jgi:hypothetical protein
MIDDYLNDNSQLTDATRKNPPQRNLIDIESDDSDE